MLKVFLPGVQPQTHMSPEKKEFIWYTVVGTLLASAATAAVDVATLEVKRLLRARRKRNRKAKQAEQTAETTPQETE